MLNRIAGSLTAFAVVTTSLGAAAARSRLTRAVTIGAEPSPAAGTTWKQPGRSDSPGPAVTGMTTRSGEPSADWAVASPSARPCAVDDTIRVTSNSAAAAARQKRTGVRMDTTVLDR